MPPFPHLAAILNRPSPPQIHRLPVRPRAGAASAGTLPRSVHGTCGTRVPRPGTL